MIASGTLVPLHASIVAFGPNKDIALSIFICSTYVPAHTSISSPAVAASIAA